MCPHYRSPLLVVGARCGARARGEGAQEERVFIDDCFRCTRARCNEQADDLDAAHLIRGGGSGIGGIAYSRSGIMA